MKEYWLKVTYRLNDDGAGFVKELKCLNEFFAKKLKSTYDKNMDIFSCELIVKEVK